MITRTITLAVVILLGIAPLARAGVTPGVRCATAKQKAATKAAAAKANCHAKGFVKGVETDPVCLDKAQAKLAQSLVAAEGKGGCASTGDAAAISAQVDAFVADLLAATPRSACPGGQIVGGYCWYYAGAPSVDCDTTCAAQGAVYDEATRTFAGSDGTDANCGAVAAAFLGGAVPVLPMPAGEGCAFAGLAVIRGTNPTTSSASSPSNLRYCACR